MLYDDKIDSLNIKIPCKDKYGNYQLNHSIRVITKKVLYNDYIASRK